MPLWKKKKKERIFKKRHILIVALVIIFILALVIAFVNNQNLFDELLKKYGVIGLFLATLLGNATIVFPVPIDLLIFLVSNIDFFGLSILTPLILSIILGFAATLGESVAYLLGYFGIRSIEGIKKSRFMQIELIKEKLRNVGSIVIMLAAFTPFPFDIVGIASGMIKFDFKRFFLACYIGKFLRILVISYAGYFSIGIIRMLFGF